MEALKIAHDLHDYEALFDEKLALFDLLNKSERVTWKGRFRAPLNDAEIAPRHFIYEVSSSLDARCNKVESPRQVPRSWRRDR